MVLTLSARIVPLLRHALTPTLQRVGSKTLSSKACPTTNNGSSFGGPAGYSDKELLGLVTQIISEDPKIFERAQAPLESDDLPANPVTYYRAALLSKLGRPTASAPSGQDVTAEVLKHLSSRQNNMPPPHNHIELSGCLENVIRRSFKKVSIRNELKICGNVVDVFGLTGSALESTESARLLLELCEDLVARLELVAKETPPPAMFSLVNMLIHRLRIMNLPIKRDLLDLALRYAAASHSLPVAQTFLRELKSRGEYLSATTFATIAEALQHPQSDSATDFIGRNKPPLSRLLLDSTSSTSGTLTSLVDRTDLTAWRAYCACLTAAHASTELHTEWTAWYQSPLRAASEAIASPSDASASSTIRDTDFVTWFLSVGTPAHAWKAFREGAVEFGGLDAGARAALVREADEATAWSEEMRVALEVEYLRDLEAVEEVLGVVWVPGEEGGRHEFVGEVREAMELLYEGREDSA